MSKNNYWKLGEIIQEYQDTVVNVSNNINLNLDIYETNIKNIFSNLDKEIVLCVGQVQSGKTRNIEKIIEYGINNEYDLIIVLAGINNILFNQTKSRIKKFITTLPNNNKARIIDDYKNEFSFSKNKTIIFPILKSVNQISQALESINFVNLTKKKILIIDDECDYASINISKDDESKIFGNIQKLYQRIYSGKLILFTGTPFANIINSKGEKANRIVNLLNYSDYCGLTYFNQHSDKNYFVIDIQERKKIYISSIYTWLISTACALIENKNFRSEFVINDDIQNNSQIDELNFVKKFFFEIIPNISKSNFLNIIKTHIKELKYEEYDFVKIIENIYHIIQFLKNNEDECFVLLNGTNNESKNFKSGRYQFCVIVGGFMVSRGFTFENLVTELFFNAPEDKIAVDTLLQRCRWFGNRKKENRVNFLRILMNCKIKKALEESQQYIDLFKQGVVIDNIYMLEEKIRYLDKNSMEVKSTNDAKK